MTIILNSKSFSIKENSSIKDLLESLSYTEKDAIAVAINLKIIRKNAWGKTIIKEKDSIDIVEAIQGG